MHRVGAKFDIHDDRSHRSSHSRSGLRAVRYRLQECRLYGERSVTLRPKGLVPPVLVMPGTAPPRQSPPPIGPRRSRPARKRVWTAHPRATPRMSLPTLRSSRTTPEISARRLATARPLDSWPSRDTATPHCPEDPEASRRNPSAAPGPCHRNLSLPCLATMRDISRTYAVQNNPMRGDRSADTCALSSTLARP